MLVHCVCCSCRRERQLNEAAYRLKRSSSHNLHQHQHDCHHSDTSDEDQPDGHAHFPRDQTPKLDKMEVGTPKSERRRLFRRKRRTSARNPSLPQESPGFLNRITDKDMLTRRQSLPPLQSLPPTPPPHTTHASTSDLLSSPAKESLNLDLQTPESNHDERLDGGALTPGGTLSPGVAQLLERVPSLRRTDSNGSIRGTRRRGSSSSSGRNGSPLSLSPTKRQLSGVGSHGNCPLPSAASSSHRASNKSTPVHRDSSIPYSKLGMSDSNSEPGTETENETGTHSSAVAGNITSTTSTLDDSTAPYGSKRKRNSNPLQATDDEKPVPANVESSLRSVYSNESSADTRASDGGNDADFESNNGEDLLDRLSEFEDTNDSTFESPASPSVADSDDHSSTSNLLFGTGTQTKSILNHANHSPSPDVTILSQNKDWTFLCDPYADHSSEIPPSILNPEPNSTGKQVAHLISKFESVESLVPHSGTTNLTRERPHYPLAARSLTGDLRGGDVGAASRPEVPLHIRRPAKRGDVISGSYSPRLAEEAWRNGGRWVCT